MGLSVVQLLTLDALIFASFISELLEPPEIVSTSLSPIKNDNVLMSLEFDVLLRLSFIIVTDLNSSGGGEEGITCGYDIGEPGVVQTENTGNILVFRIKTGEV